MFEVKKEKQTSYLQWFGEILITLGAILMLYVVWQLFVNDPVVSQSQQQQAKEYSIVEQKNSKEFVKMRTNLKQGAVFAKIYVPRFAKDYERLIGQGTFQKVTLNVVGVGHYVSSDWPGEAGNFAVAAHRTSHGAPFADIDRLKAGDKVWVKTNDSWFTYEYRQTKIVKPSEIGVIDDLPKGLTGAIAGGKYMTMTSCHPKWTNQQRIIVWLELVKTDPKSVGKPFELLEAQR
jgi:sortase A